MATLEQAGKILSVFNGTPTEQVQAILASGLLADLRDGNTARVNRDEFRKLMDLPPLNPPLFRYLDAMKIPALLVFGVPAHFKVGERDGVKVEYVDGLFTSYFGVMVEDAQPALVLQRNELIRTGSCSAINEVLGTSVEEATCGQIWALMKRQGKGQRGKLHVDGKANLFRVRNKNGVLLFVDVRWNTNRGGWRILACEVGDDFVWGAGCNVFSRARAA